MKERLKILEGTLNRRLGTWSGSGGSLETRSASKIRKADQEFDRANQGQFIIYLNITEKGCPNKKEANGTKEQNPERNAPCGLSGSLLCPLQTIAMPCGWKRFLPNSMPSLPLPQTVRFPIYHQHKGTLSLLYICNSTEAYFTSPMMGKDIFLRR